MKKYSLRTFLLILIALAPLRAAMGQEPSFGVMGGGTYYIGELNPYRHFPEEGTHGMGGGFYRHPLDKRWVFRVHGLYGKVSGSDANARSRFRKNRNLHFRSEIFEVGGAMELNFFEYASGSTERPFSPFLFAGLNYFRMNPEARYKGEWRALQPLGTEGQGVPSSGREKYSLGQLSIPFGLGLKMNLGEWVTVGAEWGMRKTFTDYIDDVSRSYIGTDRLQSANGSVAASMADRRLEKGEGETLAGKERGDPETNDWYVFSGVTLSVRVGRKDDVCSSFNSGR